MDTLIQDQVNSQFGGFDQLVGNVTQFLTQDPAQFNPTAWSIVNQIYSVFLAIGFSLLALFFLMEFIQKVIKTGPENLSWEPIVTVLLKLAIAKFLMSNCLKFLTLILGLTSGWITQINTMGGTTSTTSQMAPQIIDAASKMNVFQQLQFMAGMAPMGMTLFILKIVMMVIVYGRMIELYILTAVAPLPIATAVNDGLSGTAKKFFMRYVSVCIQGVVILIICKIYGGIISNVALGGSLWTIVFNGVLATSVIVYVIVRSSRWANTIVGL